MIPKINGCYEETGGSFQLPEKCAVVLDGFSPWCLDSFFLRMGRTYTLLEGNGDIYCKKEESLPPDGYRLRVDINGIFITAAREQGVIWALTTIYHSAKNGAVPCCCLEDAPQFPHRGLSLDCVRHFFDAAEVKRIIEEMSLVKMNVLHWQLANDQGFRIETEGFPELHTRSGKYYTKEEIRQIVEFAKIRGVEIVPEIDMPGHTTAILAAYPELSCKGQPVTLPNSGGIYPVVLCPGKDQVFSFLEKLLAEIVPLFPGKRFHIGGDEAPDWEWQECPHCRERMGALGLTDVRQLQGYFSERIKEILRRYHKDVICWCDSLEADNFQWKDTPEQRVSVQYWSIQYADRMQAYLRKGGSMIYSDMFEIYLDYPSAMSSMKKVYHCCPAIRTETYPEAEGLEACIWTEYIEDCNTLEKRLFPRLYALAENAWSKEKNYEDFQRRLTRMLGCTLARQVACQTMEEADPQGDAKKQGIQEYTAIMQSGMSPQMRELAVKFTKPNAEFEARFMQQFLGIG